MLALKPLKTPSSICPHCKETNSGFANYDFYGQHILSNGTCRHCATEYVHNWPVGHGALFPITFTRSGLSQYSNQSALWLAKPLIKHYKANRTAPAKVTRQVRRFIEEGLLINCLDPCFGHVIWKLFNTWKYRSIADSQGLVVVIPANCYWMVPDFVAEVWVVEAPLAQLQSRIPGLNELIEQEFKGSLQIPPQSSHPDHTDIDLQAYFKTAKFDLSAFHTKPFQVTLIWREDRFWVGQKWQLLWKFCTKYKWKTGLKFLAFLQAKRYQSLASKILKKCPQAKINMVGLGSGGKLRHIADERSTSPDQAREQRWCTLYAQSQVVVGVHGSSMLIPTGLAAGFVELMPAYKVPFLTEDILMNHHARYQTYLGRHLPASSSPSEVAHHVVSMYRGFSYLYQNTVTP